MLIWLQLLKHMEPIIGTASIQLGMEISVFLRKNTGYFFPTVSLIFVAFFFSYITAGIFLRGRQGTFPSILLSNLVFECPKNRRILGTVLCAKKKKQMDLVWS